MNHFNAAKRAPGRSPGSYSLPCSQASNAYCLIPSPSVPGPWSLRPCLPCHNDPCATPTHVPKQASIPALSVLALCLLAFLPGFPSGQTARAFAASASAQTFSQGNSIELDEILFVQAPQPDNGSGGIVIAWIPEPLLKSCLGRTLAQCSAMDFCIRTTTKSVPMCRNLAIPLSRLPSYPPGMRPRRVMSLSFYKLASGGPYQPLVDLYKSLPRSSLERHSLYARIKARIRLTPMSNDDSIQLEQVLSTAPF
jgi:hypothetical protein